MNVGLSNLKQLDGSSAIWDEIKEEFTDNGNYINGKLALDDNRGAVGQPSLYNKNNTSSGIEFDTTGNIKLKVNGNDNLLLTYDAGIPQATVQFTTDMIYIPDGSQSQPSLSFGNAGTSGIFKTGISGIGITTNGSQRLHIHNTYIEKFQQMRAEDGLSGEPSYSFSGDIQAGLYRSGSNDIRMTVSGDVIGMTNSNLKVYKQQLNINGTVSAPSISFTNEQKSGLYRSGTNDIRMAVNGADIIGLNANNFVLYKPLVSSFQPLILQKNTADQIITNTTATRVEFPTAEITAQSDYITWNNTSKQFEVKNDDLATGIYLVSYHFTYTASSVGDTRGAWVVISDYPAGYRFGHQSYRNGSRVTGISTAFVVKLTKNTNFYLYTYQDSGGSLNITGSAQGTYMSVYRLC